MRTRRKWWSVVVLLVVSGWVQACVRGGQSGDGEPIDRGGPEQGGPAVVGFGEGSGENGCSYETEVVSNLDAEGEPGFAPRVAIELAEGSYHVPFAFPTGPQLQLAPETGTSELRMTITYEDGQVRLRRPITKAGGAGEQGGLLIGEIGLPACPVAYEIDARLGFRTAGGAFDETLDVTLVAASPVAVTFNQPLDHEALSGSLEVVGSQPPGGVVKQVQIEGTISAFGTFGAVTGVLEYRSDDALSDVAVGGGGLLGSWPGDRRCDGPSLPVTAETDLGGYTLADELMDLSDLFPRALAWQLPVDPVDVPSGGGGDGEPPPDPDGVLDPGAVMENYETESETRVSMAVEGQAEACARFDGQVFSFELPVTVSATTEDGRLAGRYKGSVSANMGRAGLEDLRVRARMDNIPVASFGDQTGVAGVDLTGYDHGRINLWFDRAADRGELQAQGAIVADCVTNPPEPIRDDQGNVVGAPGCRGTELLTVLKGAF